MHRRAVVLIVAAAVCGLAACGGQTPASVPSPSAPSSSTTGSLSGATISGTVLGVAAASTVKPRGASMTVSVTGSSVFSSVDDNGRFTLNNAPAGHVDLHFAGNGVDAHLALEVAEHATVVITVRVSGNDAHLEDEHANDDQGEAEASGTIAAGTMSGSCAAHNLAFLVGATKVTTNASTRFTDGTCDSLKAGSHVDVKGARQSDNSIVAATVEGEAADQEPEDVEVSGTIVAGSIVGTCAAGSLSFSIGTTHVATNAATEFKDAPCASLKAGDQVEAKGVRQPDGSVLASRVEARD